MSRVKCGYFGKCAGCQYQMLSYEKQLDLKRDVVVKAYQNYSSSSSFSSSICLHLALTWGYKPCLSYTRRYQYRPRPLDCPRDWLYRRLSPSIRVPYKDYSTFCSAAEEVFEDVSGGKARGQAGLAEDRVQRDREEDCDGHRSVLCSSAYSALKR